MAKVERKSSIPTNLCLSLCLNLEIHSDCELDIEKKRKNCLAAAVKPIHSDSLLDPKIQNKSEKNQKVFTTWFSIVRTLVTGIAIGVFGMFMMHE